MVQERQGYQNIGELATPSRWSCPWIGEGSGRTHGLSGREPNRAMVLGCEAGDWKTRWCCGGGRKAANTFAAFDPRRTTTRLTTAPVPLPAKANDATLPLVPPPVAFEPRDGSTPREIAIREAPCARSPVDDGEVAQAEGSHGRAEYRCVVRGERGNRREGERLTTHPHLVSSRRATLTAQSECAWRVRRYILM